MISDHENSSNPGSGDFKVLEWSENEEVNNKPSIQPRNSDILNALERKHRPLLNLDVFIGP